MSNELTTQTRSTGFDLSPQTFEQALTFAQYLADSDMVPKDFKGKPANCLIGMQWGMELGMKPLQAIQNIAVINGRPNLWGDAMLALVRSSPLCEYVSEGWLEDGTAYCKAKRRGEPEQIRTFSDADAKTAGLLGKQGPWMTGPKRMKQMRARGFALRDVFTDVLRGMGLAEEAMDTTTVEKHMGAAVVVQTAAPESWPDDVFKLRLIDWHKAIAAGRATADSIIAKAKTKHPLTDAQMAAIREPAPQDAKPAANATHIAERMGAAKTEDELNDAAVLIDAVAEQGERDSLNAIYDAAIAAIRNTQGE